MAKSKVKDIIEDLEPLEPEVTEPEPLEPRVVESGNIGIEDAGGNVTYTTVAEGEAKERRLLIGGVSVEHCREDAQGRWIYRGM